MHFEHEDREHYPRCPMSPDFTDNDSASDDLEESMCICDELDEDSYDREMESRVDRARDAEWEES